MAIEDRPVTTTDYPALEKLSELAVKDKQKFERIVVPKETLLKMFGYNKYKKHIIETKIPDGTSTTVYRCGPMIDLCVGPHIPHTGKIKAFMVTKVGKREAPEETLFINVPELCFLLPWRSKERFTATYLRHLVPG
jgi:threonyl-tRNA synthetase